MSATQIVSLKENTANPAPLGLLAFGMTTVLLNFKNAGFIEMSPMILAMGIFYGGIAQVIAGIIEGKKNNTFGLTAFTSYGFFWLSLVGLLIMPKLGWFPAASNNSMMAFLAMWGVFTFLLFLGTFKINKALQVVFGSLTVLFFLLVIAHATGSETAEHIAGYEGIFCGASAMYAGVAQVLNEVNGKVVWPIGPVA